MSPKNITSIATPTTTQEHIADTPPTTLPLALLDPQTTPRTHQPQKRFASPSRWFLWACLLIAAVLRLWLTIRTQTVVNGDEAMVGIQAEHIVRGEWPVYFYAQPYMGSLEAYLVAILFKIAGPSVWTLRAEPTLLSLVTVWLTWKMAAALADAARIPTRAKQVFMGTAALFAAVTPLYDAVMELRMLGGYIETFVLMLILLLSAFRLTQRWREGANGRELALRWIGVGFTIGLGLWVDPLIASAIVVAALWIAGFCVGKIVRHKRVSSLFIKRLLLALPAIPALCVGFSPALYWGARNHWANITYILQLGSAQNIPASLQHHMSRSHIIYLMFAFYGNIMAPRVVGGALPVEDGLSTLLHTSTYIVGLLSIGITIALFFASFVKQHSILRGIRQMVALPLLFGAVAVIIFCTSPGGMVGLTTLRYDVAGRYATPLLIVLPFFFATTITAAILWLYEIHEAIPTIIVARIVRGICFVLLLVSLAAQAASYGMADPAATFQSPSCTVAPAHDEPIITYLRQEHVHYAWAISWLGNPITFKTNDDIITADPRTVIFGVLANRVPAYLVDVQAAQRPALLALIKHRDPHPLLLRVLNSEHITYQAALFPSEPGYDVLVVTRLSRTVSLSSSKYFPYIFGNCP